MDLALGRLVDRLDALAVSQGIKLAVFDAQMRLLWRSTNWDDIAGPATNPRELLGHGWLQFVHPDDRAPAEAWMAGGDGAVIEMRCLSANDRNQWLRVAMTKRRFGPYWIGVGADARDTHTDPHLPATPCLTLSDPMPGDSGT